MRLDTTKASAIPEDGSKITFSLLKLVSEARNEHGMRQLDYERYRQFCTKKVHRLRQTLQLTHKDAQHTVKTQGSKGGQTQKSKRSKKKQTAVTQSAADKAKGGNVYTEKTINVADVKNDRPAQLLLFEAERAWAHSQDLKSQSNEAEEDPVLRKSGLGRARRAVGWADDLFKLTESLASRVDAHTKVEVISYRLSTKASALFDKGEWESCLEHLWVARVLLTALAKGTSDSRAEALANSFIDAGEAQMRFSAYQIGEEQQDMEIVTQEIATPATCQRIVPGFDQLVQKLRESQPMDAGNKEAAVEIEWRERKIPLRNADLVDAVLRVRSQEAALVDAVKATEQHEGEAAAAAKAARAKGSKPARISHAERTARKRAAAGSVGETSKAGASGSVATQRGGQSTSDPFDHALAALTDGELLARRLVDDNADALSKSHSARYERVGDDLKAAHEWLQYRLLSLQIRRSNKMVEEVEEKAAKREARKQAALKKKLDITSSAKRSGGSGGRKKKPAADSAVKKEPKKPQPGSRAKAVRSTPSSHHRRPARSGTRHLHAQRQAARTGRARQVAEGQSLRRSARAIPALAKLLDNSESNLLSIAALSVIESDPDASTIVDGESAWYRSELLYHLARAYSLAGEKGEACLLLRRAALCVRQARQSLDLVDDAAVVEEMDADIPPALNEALFTKSERAIQVSLRKIQKEMRQLEHSTSKVVGASSSLSSTKAGQQLRLLASKHVDFDPEDVAEASRPDEGGEELEEEEVEEVEPSPVQQPKSGQAKPTRTAQEALAAVTGDDEDEAEHFEEAPAAAHAEGEVEEGSDEGEFAAAEDAEGDGEEETDSEEDEEEVVAAEQQKKPAGWLGGWFGRK
ncbi:hypothetical protein BCV69DRAFT_267506 [Microstroma glucosiphilum]|uniref:Signal recognition particle subunit SRP68 n=1 Tax=Pseudomicrostroma glucosiphilum TaxID=1684307 RepID=A0A316UAR6_9BASI|nr:hypothetical protein BCV69DRAFT_267506 [Pseudomicrostroma glucosiphilum]PWN22249.1 hypothetical protein BCV69DRAFT_267506 [Pseudomicrostroma glucosiphilum]